MDYAAVIDEVFRQIHGADFAVRLWNGKTLRYGTRKKKSFTLVISSEMTAKRLLSGGSLGFGESFVAGALDIEGDIDAYFRLRHQFRSIKPNLRMTAGALLAKHTIPRDTREQIAHHYDLGNDFFRLLLDSKTMSYSSGLYTPTTPSLGSAQQQKFQLVCDWLQLKPGNNVLDLGCGWGGFARHAVTTHDVTVTACTLSRKQYDYCAAMIKQHNLGKTISLYFMDMLRELPDGQFDSIVMLESIEHVGKKRLPEFVDTLYRKVKPGGIVYIQTSGRYKPGRVDKWTLKYVFPGGYLPTQSDLTTAAYSAGFIIDQFADDSPSYIKTLSAWVANLEKNQSKIEAMYTGEFYRLWYLWLHGAKVAYEMQSLGLFRLALKKPSTHYTR